jgi:FkbM family methyltransferase
MNSWLELALARTPRTYSWLLRRRRTVNLEKLAFLALVERGDVVYDVGANQGYYTLLFSRLVGRHGQVHAFEPVAATFAALAARVERRPRLGNVVLNACAVAGSPGQADLLVPDSDPAHASLVRHGTGSWERSAVHRESTTVTTLDDYQREHGAPPPDMVKCDAEGAEQRILEGASGTVRRQRPLLHLEVNPSLARDFGYAPHDLAAWLTAAGYSRFYLIGDLTCRLLADPGRELAAFRGSANLVCGVPELHGRRLARLRLTGGGEAAG